MFFGSSKASTSKLSDSIVTCHFCHSRFQYGSHARSDLPILYSGSPSSFQCPSCESWNLRDPITGDFVDDARIFSDTALNEASAVGRPARQRSQRRRRAAIQDPTFCQDCLTNQNLQIQLLSNYIPSDCSENEEAVLLQNLPAYRTSLDARYPLVCEDCQERVETLLRDRDWRAKARTVGGWLKRSAALGSGINADGKEQPVLHRQRNVALWRIKGTLWRALYLGTSLACCCPSEYLKGWSDRLLWPYLLSFAISSIFYAFWDPTYRLRLRRGSNCTVRGKRRWLVSRAEQ